MSVLAVFLSLMLLSDILNAIIKLLSSIVVPVFSSVQSTAGSDSGLIMSLIPNAVIILPLLAVPDSDVSIGSSTGLVPAFPVLSLPRSPTPPDVVISVPVVPSARVPFSVTESELPSLSILVSTGVIANAVAILTVSSASTPPIDRVPLTLVLFLSSDLLSESMPFEP